MFNSNSARRNQIQFCALLCTLAFLILASAGLSAQTSCTSVAMDGYTYDAVKIGDQCWFTDNLRTTQYADGTPIPEVTGTSAWAGLSSGARCNHDNDASKVSVHGRLYNWFAVTDASGLCPTGWDVPTYSEWQELETYLGANGYNGSEGTALKAASGWDDGTGTNAVGFNGRPSGHRDLHGNFGSFGDKGRYWSSTDVDFNNDRAWSLALRENHADILAESGCYYKAGVSVRCMRTAVLGCTDSGACNYSASANSDDGSCTYATTWYADADGDGLGDAADSQSSCTQPAGYVADNSDNCDDVSAYNYADPNNANCDTDFSCSEGFSYNGAHYATVQIGDQCWFQESLRTTEYRDGTSIPGGLNNSDWSSDTDGAYHQYSSNVSVYGLLYNYYAVTHSAGLCPTGWEVPSDEEWQTLEISQGMSASDAAQPNWRGASQNVGGKLKNTGTTYWNSPNSGATNSSGFTANGAGRRHDTGSTGNFKNNSFFWTRSSYTLNNGWSRYMAMDNTGIKRVTYDKNHGFAVRCLLEAEGCTDDGACNYDASAISNDGSCTYATAWYADADGDGLGDAADSQSSCTQPAGYVADNSDNCDDLAALNYALTPAEPCAYSCDDLDAPLTYTGIALASNATGPSAADGAVSLTFSGGYGSKTAHFTAGSHRTLGSHSFTLAASLTAIPQGHWSTYLVDEAGCEGRCDGCGSSARVTLEVVVPHDRCD